MCIGDMRTRVLTRAYCQRNRVFSASHKLNLFEFEPFGNNSVANLQNKNQYRSKIINLLDDVDEDFLKSLLSDIQHKIAKTE